MYKKEILKYLEKYLISKEIKILKRGKIQMVDCPKCKTGMTSATIIPNSHIINCFKCKKKYNLIDTVKLLESKLETSSDDEILQYIKDLFNIKVQTPKDEEQIDKILEMYSKLGFDMVPVVKNDKMPVEKNWTNKNHKDPIEWKQWLNNGLNIGLKTGKISGITVIDIDTPEIPEEIKMYSMKALKQKTNKGWHLFFQYEEDLPKTRIDSLKIDIENDGGQVVIYPSIVADKKRTLSGEYQIIKMPEKVKQFLQQKITLPQLKTDSEKLRQDIQTEEFNLALVEEGGRNDTLVRLMGIYRKRLSYEQTRFALHAFNKNFCNPPKPSREIEAMLRNGEKYIQHDEDELCNEILKYLKKASSATKADIEQFICEGRAKGEDKKRIDGAMVQLIQQDLIIRNNRYYEPIVKMEWIDTLMQIGVPINFKVPYFNDYVYFNWGDLIIIGSQNKYGKTSIAVNIIKRLVVQKIKPYYIYNESGGRFGKTALHIGMKDGDFNHVYCSDPNKIILEPNSVTIFDWVKPKDFAKTDELFDSLVNKVKKANGFLICFVQLKKDNRFFAENMIGQFPALLSRYVYEDDNDGTYTKFELCDGRDFKMQGKYFEIPCIYNWTEKLVYMKSELEEKKNG